MLHCTCAPFGLCYELNAVHGQVYMNLATHWTFESAFGCPAKRYAVSKHMHNLNVLLPGAL